MSPALRSARRLTKCSWHQPACAFLGTASNARISASSVRWSPSCATNFWRAARASSRLARGSTHTPSLDTAATTCIASCVQCMLAAASSTLPYMGSTGRRPSGTPTCLVSAPLAGSSAPSASSSSSARMMAARGGGSKKSKPSTSLTPSALSCSTTDARLVRRISGGVAGGSSPKDASVYRRYALPGASRPARPLRCRACACDTGTTCSESAPSRAEYARALTKPVSTTNLTPGMVMDVSAMLVASTALRTPGGAGSNTRICCSGGMAAKMGSTSSSVGAPGGREAAGGSASAAARSASRRSSDSISSWPVRNTRMSPGPSSTCTCSAALSAPSRYDSSGAAV
mmetsp:Transcript_35449/g.89727  ORF Transcript_35449/g.89727 Transcript_35449/m.89727 type:complete len:343 (+) Transcript_35449:349-1377(+)